MSIQQNVNQLLTMAGTAAMLSPQLRQKTEDNTKLRKLDKEEAGLMKIQEDELEASRSPEALLKRRKIMTYRERLEKGETLSNIEKTEYEVLDKEAHDTQDARNERRIRLLEIANERAELSPTKENIEAARNLRKDKGAIEVLQEKGKRKREEALQHMKQEGQNKLDQKTEFEKFKESLSSDDNFHSLSPAAQQIAYEQYTKGGK